MYPDRVVKSLQRAQANLNAGNPAAILDELEKTLQKFPKVFEAWQMLGHARGLLGDLAAAKHCFRQAAALQPKNADAWAGLGRVCQPRREYDEAIAAYRRAISLVGSPQPELAYHLASCLVQLDRYEEAVPVLKDAAPFDTTPALWTLLGIAYQGLDRYSEALAAYLDAVERGGRDYSLFLNIGTCHYTLGDSDAAAEYAQRALACQPGDRVALYNLGAAWLEIGRIDDAIRAFEQSTLPAARASRLVALNYLDPADPLRLRREHEDAVRSWLGDARAARPMVPRSSGERLRIGLVSHDFRQHPVAHFLEGMLREIDRTRYELFFYADVRNEDDVTARFRAWGDRWRDIRRLDNPAFAAQAAADKIHLMLDLAGHTNGDRLVAFAGRLAPVQATYLGYGATTGLPTIDYMLADDVIAPVAEGDAPYTEQVVRLGPILASYSPPATNVPLAPVAPLMTNGYPTFGSFAQLRKISPTTVSLWISALQAVPDARLRVMSKGLATEAARARFLAPFVAAGIDPERFDLRAAGSLDEYLAAHNEVDLILDTLPWSGHTTTLHALWMGVPTLALRGNTQTGRFGEMVLRALGMEAFLVTDPALFGHRAAELVAHALASSSERTALRRALLDSPLCDHPAMARRFEQACDLMWATAAA